MNQRVQKVSKLVGRSSIKKKKNQNDLVDQTCLHHSLNYFGNHYIQDLFTFYNSISI